MPKAKTVLAEHIGDEASQILIETFGGHRLYIPTAWSSGHPLSLLLGPKAAEALIAQYGGRQIDVPKGLTDNNLRRDAAIRRDHSDGVKGVDLVRKYELSWRTISKVIYGRKK